MAWWRNTCDFCHGLCETTAGQITLNLSSTPLNRIQLAEYSIVTVWRQLTDWLWHDDCCTHAGTMATVSVRGTDHKHTFNSLTAGTGNETEYLKNREVLIKFWMNWVGSSSGSTFPWSERLSAAEIQVSSFSHIHWGEILAWYAQRAGWLSQVFTQFCNLDMRRLWQFLVNVFIFGISIWNISLEVFLFPLSLIFSDPLASWFFVSMFSLITSLKQLFAHSLDSLPGCLKCWEQQRWKVSAVNTFVQDEAIIKFSLPFAGRLVMTHCDSGTEASILGYSDSDKHSPESSSGWLQKHTKSMPLWLQGWWLLLLQLAFFEQALSFGPGASHDLTAFSFISWSMEDKVKKDNSQNTHSCDAWNSGIFPADWIVRVHLMCHFKQFLTPSFAEWVLNNCTVWVRFWCQVCRQTTFDFSRLFAEVQRWCLNIYSVLSIMDCGWCASISLAVTHISSNNNWYRYSSYRWNSTTSVHGDASWWLSQQMNKQQIALKKKGRWLIMVAVFHILKMTLMPFWKTVNSIHGHLEVA